MSTPEPPAAAGPASEERWARQLLADIAFATVVEKRRTRRWGIFFKFVFFFYLVALLVLLYPLPEWLPGGHGGRHTAVVSVEGLIASSTPASAEKVIAGLRAAFKNPQAAGVILKINSPGGSAVQAGEIYQEVQRLRKAYPNTPVYTVVSDLCASGGYYIAAATQKIYANQASIVGSIGVRADSFGFEDVLGKLGINRRLYTAGDHKAFLDPFTAPRPEDVQHLQTMLDGIHQQFIAAVRQGRGDRLRETPTLFSGLIWTGQQSVELGLVDELADLRHVAEVVIGAEKIVDYSRRTPWVERLMKGIEAGLDATLLRWETLDNRTPAL